MHACSADKETCFEERTKHVRQCLGMIARVRLTPLAVSTLIVVLVIFSNYMIGIITIRVQYCELVYTSLHVGDEVNIILI
jgi:hypothetical protein